MLPGMMVHAGTEVQASADATESPEVVQAVWMPREIEFYYRSFTTFYSCASLTNKVRRLLLELGAQQNIDVRSSGCFSEISRMPVVKIRLTSPVQATPEALAELAKTRATRELIARVRGERLEGAETQFPAYWKRVSLSRGYLQLESGDCELVDELKRKVLPQMSIRIVLDDTYCSPQQYSSGPRLEVEALTVLADEVPAPVRRQALTANDQET